MVYAGFSLTAFSFLFIIGYIAANILLSASDYGRRSNPHCDYLFRRANLLALSIIGKYVQVLWKRRKVGPQNIVDKRT